MGRLQKTSIALVTLVLTVLSFWPVSQEKGPDKILLLLQREARGLNLTTKLEIAETVLQLSHEYRIDPMLILAVMKVESRFELQARSNRGALGLMQVRPIVVRDVAKELGIDPMDHGRLLTSHKFNIRVGVHYFSNLMKKFGGDIRKALMAYNAGPTFVARLYKNRPVPPGGYQGKVWKVYEGFSGS